MKFKFPRLGANWTEMKEIMLSAAQMKKAPATFHWKVDGKGKKTYRVTVTPSIDTWPRPRKAQLVLGLVLCQQAIDVGEVDPGELMKASVEPEVIKAALTLYRALEEIA